MPNDLVIRPTGPPNVPEPAAAPAVPSVGPASGAVGGGNALPNPTMRLDPALGLVVIEFHNQAGSVTTSIPGPKQLDAYRAARDLNHGREIEPGTTAGVHPSATRKV